MPRNGSGTYSLPAGNPVETGTVIEAEWANTTLSDLGNEITNSLSRTGIGGMLAPFRLADGTVGAPGIAWTNEPSTGFYRSGAGEMWGVVGGAQVLQYTSNGVLLPSGKTLTINGSMTFSSPETIRAALKAVGYTTTTGSAILPSGTTAQRDVTPAAGYVRYNTDTNVAEVYNGTTWNTMQNVSISSQTFSGTGAQTAFTLSSAPVSVESTSVFISGVRQYPTTNYTISGTTLTFVVAPPTGTNNILVQWLSALSTNVPTDGSVTTAKLADASVTTAKLADASVTTPKIATSVTLTTPTLSSATPTVKTSVAATVKGALVVRADSALPGVQDGVQIEGSTVIGLSSGTGLDSGTLVLQGQDLSGLGGGTPQVTVNNSNLNITGTGLRIRGDFSNATIANRLMFQTSTTNDTTVVSAIPNGTGTTAQFSAVGSSDPTNASVGNFAVLAGTDVRVVSGRFGTGTFLPMTFYTNGSERMRIDTTGNVLVTNNGGGLGYGTGAGGTVTQATSKSTAVTLNRPTGVITMNNAALGAGATVAFTLNNSLLASTDMLVLNHLTGGGPENYNIWAGNGSAGAKVIYVRNISGGSLSDAIQISFAVIKGVTT